MIVPTFCLVFTFTLAICGLLVECAPTPDHEPANVVVAEPQYEVLQKDGQKKEVPAVTTAPAAEKPHQHQHKDNDPLKDLEGIDLASGPQYQVINIKKEEKKKETTIHHHHEYDTTYAINTGADKPEHHVITMRKEEREKDDKGIEHHHKKETSLVLVNMNLKRKNSASNVQRETVKPVDNSLSSVARPSYQNQPQPQPPRRNQYAYNYDPFRTAPAYPSNDFGYQYQPYQRYQGYYN